MRHYQINPHSTIPVYRQLSDQINAEIRSGVLPKGTQLPTVREMAEQMNLSCGTVKRVYDRLQEMGDIEMTRRRGTYVKFVREDGDSRKIRAMAAIDGMMRQLSEMNFSLKEIQIFLNLKMREWGLKRSGIRITIIHECAELEDTLLRQLNALGNVTVSLCSLRQLREYPYSVEEQADVILADADDRTEVEALLPDRSKLILIALNTENDFLMQAMRLLPGRIGVLCREEAFFELVKTRFPDDLRDCFLPVFAGLSLPDGEEIREMTALIAPEGYERMSSAALNGEIQKKREQGRLLVFRYGMDPGSLLYLGERINRIRDERQLMPGTMDF